MNNPKSEYVIVGKVGATYGIKGWLKIVSFTEPMTNILEYKPWYLQEGQTWKAVKISGGREHGKGIVIHIAGYDTPESARLLTGKTIGIQRTQLPALKKQEYYWSDLEGLTVINQRGETLGKVIYLIATGSNDVIVIKGEKEHAIPYLPGDTITKVDLSKQEIHVDWDLI